MLRLLSDFLEVIRLLTSILLAWLAVLFAVLSAVLHFAKRSGRKKLRRVFSRIHITVGVLLIVTELVHGILAGNPSWATLTDMTVAPVLFSWNWGTLSLIAAILLGVSYLLRRRMKKYWMVAHRVLTVALVALIVLHVADVGIQLDDRVAAVVYAETVAAEPAAQTTSLPAETTAAAINTATVAATAASTATAAATTAPTTTVSNADTSSAAAIVAEAGAQFSGATLIDGVYTGSASGYNGAITVSVTVSEGQVTAVDILSENDTRSYFYRAETVIDTILTEQSLEVDAVSGATYSSAGIVNAVADALSGAVDSGDLGVTEFSYSGGSHGGHRH